MIENERELTESGCGHKIFHMQNNATEPSSTKSWFVCIWSPFIIRLPYSHPMTNNLPTKPSIAWQWQTNTHTYTQIESSHTHTHTHTSIYYRSVYNALYTWYAQCHVCRKCICMVNKASHVTILDCFLIGHRAMYVQLCYPWDLIIDNQLLHQTSLQSKWQLHVHIKQSLVQALS